MDILKIYISKSKWKSRNEIHIMAKIKYAHQIKCVASTYYTKTIKNKKKKKDREKKKEIKKSTS